MSGSCRHEGCTFDETGICTLGNVLHLVQTDFNWKMMKEDRLRLRIIMT